MGQPHLAGPAAAQTLPGPWVRRPKPLSIRLLPAPNAWVTKPAGNYNASEQSYVESPCFNMSTLIQPVVEMKIWWNSEFSCDGAVLQSSIDGGATWQNSRC